MSSESTEAASAAPVPQGGRPTPLPRVVIVLVGAGAVFIAIAGLRSASDIVGPAFFALVLTIVAHPARVYAQRRGWPGWTGFALGATIVYGVLIGLTLALVASMAKLATLLPTYKDDAADLLNDITGALDRFGVGEGEQQTVASSFDVEKATNFIVDILGNLAALSSDLFFIITLLFFMAIDASWFPSRLRETGDHHRDLAAALSSFANGTRRYLVVSTIFGFIVAVIDTAFLALVGIPAALVWGLLAFITNYIPNIGFVIGLIPPAVLALLEGGPDLMLLVIAVYCVVNFVIQSMIQPKFVGDAVGLSVTMTMLSLVFWAWVLGAVGALLAIPLTLLAKALLVDADPHLRWLLPILSGDPANPPDQPELAKN